MMIRAGGMPFREKDFQAAGKGESMEMCAAVSAIVEGIRSIADPEIILMYGRKRDVSSGQVNDVDLCVVAATDNKDTLQNQIYLLIDSDISFDIIIYTPEEWDTLSVDTQSFAHRIEEKGIRIYERETR